MISLCSQISPFLEEFIQNLNSNLNLNQNFKMLKNLSNTKLFIGLFSNSEFLVYLM